MNYYQHHIGDFNHATRHLTRIERSIYRDLIELYYDTERPLPADQDRLARLVLARDDDERAALVVVLDEYFTLDGDTYTHARCDAEIEKVYQKSDKARESARKRWERKANANPETPAVVETDSDSCAGGMRTQCERNADGMLPNTQYPIPNTQLDKGQKRKRFVPPTLEEIQARIYDMGYDSVDAETFYNFYEAKGWLVGKNKMRSWHAALAGWQSRNKTGKPPDNSTRARSLTDDLTDKSWAT